MPTAANRFFKRFLIAAAAGTALALCLISTFRLAYVHRVIGKACRAETAGQTDSMLRELRLAYRWAPAYKSLREPARRLYRDAISRAGLADPVPEMRRRSFSAALPVLEKALIPADLLVDMVYQLFGPGTREPPSPKGSAGVRPSPPPTGGEEMPSGGTEDDLDLAEDAAGTPAEPPAGPPAGESGAEEPPPMQDSSAEAPAPDTAEPPADTPVEAVPREPEKAPEPPAPDPEAMWGVVTLQDAAVYDQKGIKTRSVPAGSLVDIRRLQTVPGGDVIHGTVWSRAGTFPNVILRRGDVEIHQGMVLSATTRQHRELVSRRAERLAAIEERKRELANAEAIRNPHQQEYRKVLREYKRIGDESAKLKPEFESATGNRRMELANRLRVLKNEQATLMPRYQDLKQKKEDWDRENREEDRPRDPGRDPRIEQWSREVRELDEQIRDTSTTSRENDDG